MKSFVTLTRKDLKGYFDQPTGYILIVIFLGLTSYLFFQSTLSTEEASLRAMFDLMPWVLGVFVPAATMRLIAEEQRDGTLEILFTQPIRAWTVVGAKFVAAMVFVSIAVFLTLGIPVALSTAGDLDVGAVVAQYVGTLLLTGAFVAVGLFGSSLTQNQIVAFMVALTVTLVSMLMGLPIVTLALPQEIGVVLQDLSPLSHFTGIARGVLDLRDILYFLALVSVFLSGTYMLLKGKSVSHRSPRYLTLQAGVAALVVVSLLVGLFGGVIRGRLDLTENRQYTLSPAAVDLLRGLDDIVTMTFFVSKKLPVQASLVARDVDDFLADVEAAANGNVKLVIRHPDEDDEAATDAVAAFIPAVQFNVVSEGEFKVQVGHLGIGMTYGARREAIPFIESVDGLEQRVATAVNKMTQLNRRSVGFLAAAGAAGLNTELLSLRNQLAGQYDVSEVAFDDDLLDLSTIEVLVIPGPTEFVDPIIINSVHNFLATGGSVMALSDPVTVDQTRLSARVNEGNLGDLLAEYGVVPEDDIVFDLRSNESLTFSTPFGPVDSTYPYWLRVRTVEDGVSGGVQSAVLPWASSLRLTESTAGSVDVEVVRLLETSPSAVSDREFDDLSPGAEHLRDVPDSQLGTRLLGVALKGTRCEPLEPRCERDPDNPFRLIAIGDSTWLTDAFADQYPEQVALAANYVDWLAQDPTLASIRAKGTTLRRLLFDSKTHRNLVQYSNLLGIPLLVIVLGIARYSLRQNPFRTGWGLRGRQVGIVAVGAAVVIVAVLGARVFSSEAGVAVITGIDEITEDVVDRVVIRGQESELSLVKVQGKWGAGTTGYYHLVEEFLVDRMWEAAGLINRAQLIARDPATHVQTGVTTEQAKVLEFWDGDSLKERFLLADESPIWTEGSRLCYLRSEDSDEVYGFFCPRERLFHTDVNAWYDREPLATPREDIELLKYTYADGSFEIRRQGTDWAVTGDGASAISPQQIVRPVLREIEFLQVSGFVTEQDAAAIDFSVPDAVLELEPILGASSTASRLLFIERDTDDGSYYLKEAGSPSVYVLDGRLAGLILRSRQYFAPVSGGN